MTDPHTPPFPALTRAVTQVRARHAGDDPVDRAAALGELVAALQAEVVTVTHERDDAILKALEGMSHRALARRLGLKPQRIDALVELAKSRGTRQRPAQN